MYSENIKQKFSELFNQTPDIIVRAPGRINLIGEHTDYNEGFVLPAAIDKAIYFAVSKRDDKLIKLYAYDLADAYEFSLDSIEKSTKGWANFLIGMVAEMTGTNHKLTQGFNVVFGGDVPLGAGLSSSAAVESGIGFALSELFGFELSGIQLALTAQQAEHNFAGVKCGIMDMFASIHGKDKCVIKLDCRDLSYEYFPFNTAEYAIILCNSGVKHNLGDTEYNKRRAECEEGISILQGAFPQIDTLRDVTIPMLRSQADKLPQIVYNRCRYVVEEIHRVEEACKDLLKDDFVAFGEKMYETHTGLSELYEVSCPELDFLVEQTLTNDAVAGARMMGGGFGGCTINLVKKEAVDDFLADISQAYEAAFGQKLVSYKVAITNGVEAI
ncbi:galactokinase [Emticicia agri]|uniref:Galactokinase n=1 Tax=Emticicia agri TaxID=2492393 RepID=A0A4Q5LVS8_9BACT|nr:galactokinase [Emticicia agri]RYU93792.1 galactokinase [Emticicia agri]